MVGTWNLLDTEKCAINFNLQMTWTKHRWILGEPHGKRKYYKKVVSLNYIYAALHKSPNNYSLD